MNKQEALARMDKLRSALERMPDEIKWVSPELEGLAFGDGKPRILCPDNDEFSALTDLFHAQLTRRECASPDWYALTFEVDGVTLYNLYKVDKQEENEHGEQGSGNQKPSGDGTDSEVPEEARAERGHGGCGHQADGEYPSEQRH